MPEEAAGWQAICNRFQHEHVTSFLLKLDTDLFYLIYPSIPIFLPIYLFKH